MNDLGSRKIPFLFVIDFDMKKPFALPLSEIDPKEILFDLNGVSNYQAPESNNSKKLSFTAYPTSFDRYRKAFELVQQNIFHGNSFLLNLTMPSRLETNFNMIEIFLANIIGDSSYTTVTVCCYVPSFSSIFQSSLLRGVGCIQCNCDIVYLN